MDGASIFQSLLALVAVLGLIGLTSVLLRKYAQGISLPGKRNSSRLALVDSLVLDARRKLVLIAHDGKEHLILLAPDHVLLVDERAALAKKPKKRSAA